MKQKLMTLKDKADFVREVLRGKGRFWVGVSQSDDQFERVIVTASDLHIHRHDIEAIEQKAGLELSWMRFWYHPAWKKMEPKWFAENHNGKFWELMFVKDLRKPISTQSKENCL